MWKVVLRLFLRAPFTMGALVGGLLAGLHWFAVCLPDPLFGEPFATAVFDRDGRMLGARIAADEQWRFPLASEPPARWVDALVTAEDKRFFWHPGVDPIAIGRALSQNIRQGRVVSGGSTLSMQVIRMARGNPPRTLPEKVLEAFLAFRLEMRYSKTEILRFYGEHAPFGGNTVGLEAASWRYFQRAPGQLSWAEAALLAVLPNNPAAIHPGKNRAQLQDKRDRLLDQLLESGKLSVVDRDLARLEPLPDPPGALENQAPHLVEAYRATGQTLAFSSLDIHLQRRANLVLSRYVSALAGNGVHNSAALIIENRTGLVRAYCGNVASAPEFQAAVDLIHAPRSSGSILKPFLFAGALDDGLILYDSILPDVPAQYAGYAPKNFDHTYDGAIPANDALARSRNVPFVSLLAQYNVARFQILLQKMGASTLVYSPDHYGLSLVLGGAETNLWDLAQMYSGLARTLTYQEDHGGIYPQNAFEPPRLDPTQPIQLVAGPRVPALLEAQSIYQSFQAMTQLERPESQGLWQFFSSSQKIAWKTGTSFGFRDAWAVGLNPDYTIAVWVGNADGEGRPGLTGMTCAGPILFELFGLLPRAHHWFQQPKAEQVLVCDRSGYLAGPSCRLSHLASVSPKGTLSRVCPYHQKIWIDSDSGFQVNATCDPSLKIEAIDWFVLPPNMAYFYGQQHANYRKPPRFHPSCQNEKTHAMSWVYPEPKSRILIPVELNGLQEAAVFQVAHSDTTTKIFWHLDQLFLGTTEFPHQMGIQAKPGLHHLVLVDERGQQLTMDFEVLANSQQQKNINIP
ncbi:MAG: penicillin-binding protein 1C [Acidobacteria bacterium]|nr:penicillin-binding protein 1C [Acidobacteriota bacterium]MCB9398369.1 penicillin-binding protein 1C [Acidobacteriota bacterium]